MTDSLTIRAGEDSSDVDAQIERACDQMERIHEGDRYARITVHRHWSRHNPVISGEIARPSVYRWYLRRELLKLARRGAEIRIEPSRRRMDLNDPALLTRIDERDLNITQKKLFLFGPERVELSIKRLEHYTGTRAESFQRHILLTNYQMHMDAFETAYPNCTRPSRPDVQMPAYHHQTDDSAGISIVNIGVGPSNAKNCTDHLAVLRPDVMLMVGHCAGVRNHQEIGDFVLASGYMRADRLLDDALPAAVPIAPSFLLNRYLATVLEERNLTYRVGTVYSTVDRNWELALSSTLDDLRASRAIAVDMESATVAANGFRYRIPNATLLCVSDKPLHGSPKLPDEAQHFYHETKKLHIAVAIAAIELGRRSFPDGFPNTDIRALDEPLIGGPEI
ncbi:AMP nucleosidase [candidate division BRC1 bacterium SM23_51]|nr:MAG: AMP nucleosidase [candidate division BRC1 bacterium SM23_51]